MKFSTISGILFIILAFQLMGNAFAAETTPNEARLWKPHKPGTRLSQKATR